MATRRSKDIGNDKDRLRPALLDRLTDNDRTSLVESADTVYITEARLRTALLRDLNWLLNANNATSHIDFEGLPDAERSVINYGVTPLSGQLLSELEWKDVETRLHKAILTFEPRILAETLVVNLMPSSTLLNHHNNLQFEIRCQFWSLPYPLELLLKTSLDLESGLVVVSSSR